MRRVTEGRSPFQLLTVVIAVMVVTGCQSQSSSPDCTTQDSWHSPPPARFGQEPLEHVPSSCVFEVSEARVREAEQLLETVSCSVINFDVARGLVGSAVTAGADRSFFLVRGVYLRRQTGFFDVRTSGDALHVHHEALREIGAVPMKRQPLVVLLKTRPARVYTSATLEPCGR